MNASIHGTAIHGTAIDARRICGSRDLVELLDLGVQAFTGLFRRADDALMPYGPLQLVKCSESTGDAGSSNCGTPSTAQ